MVGSMEHAPFQQRITRSPRPHDTARGADVRAAFGATDTQLGEVIEGTAGSSPYLAGLIEREAEWLRGALAGAPEAAINDLLAEADALSGGETGTGLRRLKRRAALLIALADLAGVWSLEAATGALTRFADAAVNSALRAALAPELARGRIPGQGEDDLADAAGLAVIAMGKALGLRVIAEGVETLESLNFLKDKRCHLAQGFFFSPPIPVEKFEDLLYCSN